MEFNRGLVRCTGTGGGEFSDQLPVRLRAPPPNSASSIMALCCAGESVRDRGDAAALDTEVEVRSSGTPYELDPAPDENECEPLMPPAYKLLARPCCDTPLAERGRAPPPGPG